MTECAGIVAALFAPGPAGSPKIVRGGSAAPLPFPVRRSSSEWCESAGVGTKWTVGAEPAC